MSSIQMAKSCVGKKSLKKKNTWFIQFIHVIFLELPSFIWSIPRPAGRLGIHQRLRLVQPFSFGQCLGRKLSRPENGGKPIVKHHLLYPPGDTLSYLFVGTSIYWNWACTHFQTKPCEKTSTVLAISLESRTFCTGDRCFLPSNFKSFPVFPWQARLARG